MGLREDKKRELRERILATTVSLFGERGFGSTRVADIAAQLRISEATFFNYFPTKQAVLKAAVRDRLVAAISRSLPASVQPSGDTTETVAGNAPGNVTALVHSIGAEVAAAFAAGQPLAELLARQPDTVAAGFLAAGPSPDVLTAMFASAQDRGEVRADVPPGLLADLLLGALCAAVCAALPDRPGQPDPAPGTAVGDAVCHAA
ncbi:MAG TPA: TetR/AcrR family transcriptional regulator, partial [Jatrophihabitans sp.]|nr:TetR/AcrR family transcriptional regulator [Jatrophihabitans sp.]